MDDLISGQTIHQSFLLQRKGSSGREHRKFAIVRQLSLSTTLHAARQLNLCSLEWKMLRKGQYLLRRVVSNLGKKQIVGLILESQQRYIWSSSARAFHCEMIFHSPFSLKTWASLVATVRPTMQLLPPIFLADDGNLKWDNCCGHSLFSHYTILFYT